jgi:hypothetical protein
LCRSDNCSADRAEARYATDRELRSANDASCADDSDLFSAVEVNDEEKTGHPREAQSDEAIACCGIVYRQEVLHFGSHSFVVVAVSHRRRVLSWHGDLGVRSTLNRPAPGDYQAQREV